VLCIFFVSSFVSNFVFSVVVDMYCAYALVWYDVYLVESTVSVLMDCVLGVLFMVVVGVCALPFACEIGIQCGFVMALSIAFAVCVVAGAIVFNECVAVTVRWVVDFVLLNVVHYATAAFIEVVCRYSNHHVEFVRVLGMSIVVQVIWVV